MQDLSCRKTYEHQLGIHNGWEQRDLSLWHTTAHTSGADLYPLTWEVFGRESHLEIMCFLTSTCCLCSSKEKHYRVISAEEEWTPHAKSILHVKADVAIHAPKECERFLTHRMKFGGESSADSQVDQKMAWESWEEQLSGLGSSGNRGSTPLQLSWSPRCGVEGKGALWLESCQ